MIKKLAFLLIFSTYVYSLQAEANPLGKEIEVLSKSLSSSLESPVGDLILKHIINIVSSDGSFVVLEDGMSFNISWWDQGISQKWKKGDQIYIYADNRELKLKHAVLNDSVLAYIAKNPDDMIIIQSLPNEVQGTGNYISLSNGTLFKAIQNSGRPFKEWKERSRIAILAAPTGSYQLWNFDENTIIRCKFVGKQINFLAIQDLPDEQTRMKIRLTDGKVYKGSRVFDFLGWNTKDPVKIFANGKEGTYWLINITQKGSLNYLLPDKIVECKVEDSEVKPTNPIKLDGILSLEDKLNQKILQQPQASKALSRSLLIYSAAIKEKEKPIGVFLFLGPSGVGKTEIAKVLAQEIYLLPNSLIRFDMSHFTEPHSIARLIGSPPGYVNHEEGGQLTKSLRETPYSVVLLDEMEKAHPNVRKAFLPIFDEGIILDNKNQRTECTNTMFIMTSNLCGQKIAELYHKGYQEEDILSIIEPALIEELSAELYNRVEPILFRPLEPETMEALVDLMVRQLSNKLLVEKEIKLIIDPSVTHFLVEKGYHPLLGARPLKKLIEKKVIAALAMLLFAIK